MIKIRKGNKVLHVEEKQLQEHLNDGYVKVEPKKVVEKKPATSKAFKQMGSGEQIEVINALQTVEELEALKTQEPKKTALDSIEARIKELGGL